MKNFTNQYLSEYIFLLVLLDHSMKYLKCVNLLTDY